MTSKNKQNSQRPESSEWRSSLYDIIFEADTPRGRWFDIALLVAILTSITLVALETVKGLQELRGLPAFFSSAEWVLTGLFTIEYILRLMCVRKPMRYVFSFWGVIDVLSILPSYITPFVGASSHSFVMLRSIRLLRVFRVLKLWRMMNEADDLSSAVWKARNKIIVFMMVVLVAVTISGALMFYIETVIADENADSQFTSIPQSMYWAIVTMSTVGYGDVVPQTAMGKVISAILILLGYSLIIVPSGVVTAEIIQNKSTAEERHCDQCEALGHRADATYCHRCGTRLDGGATG